MDFKTTYDFHGDGLSKIVRELMLSRKFPCSFIPDLMVRIELGGGLVSMIASNGGKSIARRLISIFLFM